MEVKATVTIKAPKETVWEVICDIEGSKNTIRSIDELEVLERPASGLVGFKWRETRTMFGKTATETMWVTDVVPQSSYDVRAESHGAVYLSTLSIERAGDDTLLRMTFNGEPQSLAAKVMGSLLGWMFKGATRKALTRDLEDIRTEAQRRAAR